MFQIGILFDRISSIGIVCSSDSYKDFLLLRLTQTTYHKHLFFYKVVRKRKRKYTRSYLFNMDKIVRLQVQKIICIQCVISKKKKNRSPHYNNKSKLIMYATVHVQVNSTNGTQTWFRYTRVYGYVQCNIDDAKHINIFLGVFT